MTDTILGIIVGTVVYVMGMLTGYVLALKAFKNGAAMVDRIHHDLVPFDEELNTDPMPSHTDGSYLDEEE